jgi:hypothetical protein
MDTTQMTKTKRAARRRKSRRSSPAATGCVVPAKYRDQYEDGSCGDDLAVKLRKPITTI